MAKKDPYIFGSTDPSKTADFYKVLGIKLVQRVKGLESDYSGKLVSDTEPGEKIMHVIPDDAPQVPHVVLAKPPRNVDAPLAVTVAVLVLSLHATLERLSANNFITDESQVHIREMDEYAHVAEVMPKDPREIATWLKSWREPGARSTQRSATLLDPDGRLVLLVEGARFNHRPERTHH